MHDLASHATRKRSGPRVPMGLQVWLGVGALCALMATSVLVGVFLIVGLKRHESHLNDRVVPYARAVASAALNAKGVANDERGYLMTGDQKFVDEAESRIRDARAWFAASVAAASSDAQRRAATEASTGFQRWVTTVRGEFAASQTTGRRGSITASVGPDRALRKRYEAALARAQALGDGAIRSGDQSVEAASSRSITILLVCLLVALTIGVGIAYWLVRSIAVPVARLVAIFSVAEDLRTVS
jgi:methyl-accepting chemotaxis protein